MTVLPSLERMLGDAAEALAPARSDHAAGARTTSRARRGARGRVRGNWRRWRPLALIVVLVLGGATGALAAAGVFQAGAPLGPGAPVAATAGNGAATSARLMALRVADPGGGLSWGVKVIHTTRQETCIQVGRVDFGTVGVLGQDGAFSNDGRFHPLSKNYELGFGCGTADVNGNAFLTLALNDLPSSGLPADCRPAGTALPARLPAIARKAFAHQPVCRLGELRNVFFGLLGPDATSITYATPSGRLLTASTAGSDGAYLIVLPYVAAGAPCGPHRAVCPPPPALGNSDTGDGVLRAVHYRNGTICRLALPGTATPGPGEQVSCPPVGYKAPSTPAISASRVVSAIKVRVRHSRFYCADGNTLEPCGPVPPRGFHELRGQPPSLLVSASFISHVAITNSSSYYYIEFDNPNPEAPSQSSNCNPHNAAFGGTDSNYRVGQLVTDTQFVPLCRGDIQGSVTLIAPTGPNVPAPQAPTNASRNLPVGQFTIHIP
jgi:hypothetical protein